MAAIAESTLPAKTELSVRLHWENPNGLVEVALGYAKHYYVGDGVRHVNAFTYYRLGKYVHDLIVVQKNVPVTVDVIQVLVHGSDALKGFYQNEDGDTFRSSIEAARSLEGLIALLLDAIARHSGTEIPPAFDADVEESMRRAVAHFESMLGKELGDLPLFCIEQQGNLSTRRLLTGASAGYPENIRKHLTILQTAEIDASGKCLAVRQGTACGFHILRAVESLVYHFAVKASGSEPKKRDWGHYCELLENNGANKDVTAIMRQINNLYRKPLMHPEDTLTPDEAVSLFGVCQSAIEGLVKDMLAKGFLP